MQDFFTYHFSTKEKQQLQSLLTVSVSPYADYKKFFSEIRQRIESSKLPEFLIGVCETIKTTDLNTNPVFILKNCPIDNDLPIFDIEDPLQSKYQLKHSFISEAFLNIFAELTNNVPLRYKNIN